MTVSTSTSIFLLSLTAIPLSYTVNTASALHGELGLLISGIVCLSVLCLLVFLVVRKKDRPTDPLYYVLILGTFSSVADTLIGLDNDGILRGFMTQYLEQGEPYLKTPYGIFICYWDGIAHYLMYLGIMMALSRNQSYREIGLYWAGSIGHSMIVFIPGNLTGKHGIHPSFLLNVPYMIFPFLCGARFLRERPTREISVTEREFQHQSIWQRPLDVVLIVGLILSMATACVRAFAALGCNNETISMYTSFIEPYLLDPVAYPKIQMLVYFYYFIPFYIMAIYGLLYPGNSWLPDWSLLHAGAAAQAQFAHIGASLHSKTPYSFRVPMTPEARLGFWTVNLGLLLLPQLLALRCQYFPELFSTTQGRAGKYQDRVKKAE